MKKSVIITLHFAYWLVYAFMMIATLVLVEYKLDGSWAFTSFSLNVLLSASCFYTFYFFLVPKFLAVRNIRMFAISALCTCFIGTVIMHFLGFLLNPSKFEITREASWTVVVTWLLSVFFTVVIGMVHGLLATFMRGFFIWYDEIHVKEILEKKNIEIQLSLLKAKINPHFLFNTLNNIDVLIKTNVSMASHYLQKLSHIMRFVLYENQPERISLEKEVDVMREYIDLESIRMTNKDFATIEVNGAINDISIAPMLFIPFLENAIKHSGDKKVNHGIKVEVQPTHDGKVKFVCRNLIGQPQQIFSDGGLGLDLIRQRLNLLYPDKHVLALKREDDYFEVNLTVDTR